jgi:2,3-bisphosphoglycerate-independent phosphoglycerate mutase
MKQIVTKTHEHLQNPLYTVTQYDREFDFCTVIFQKQSVGRTLGETVSENGLKQLRVAETEKYPHVTYFFNGGVEVQFNGEQRAGLPSNKVLHNEKPEMQAKEITDTVTSGINDISPEFILVNYANPDMVGHTGDFGATVKAVETVDRHLKELCEVLSDSDYVTVIIADHGNADYMFDLETGQPHTAHTLARVPFIVFDPNSTENQALNLKQDKELGLSAVAGTVLELMGITKPDTDFPSLIQ